MLLICWFSKVSNTFTTVWIGIFATCWWMIFFGAIAASVAFVGAFTFFAISLYKFTTGGGY